MRSRLPAIRTSQGRFGCLTSRYSDTYLHIYQVGCPDEAIAKAGQKTIMDTQGAGGRNSALLITLVGIILRRHQRRSEALGSHLALASAGYSVRVVPLVTGRWRIS